jgi:hypothetical protein
VRAGSTAQSAARQRDIHREAGEHVLDALTQAAPAGEADDANDQRVVHDHEGDCGKGERGGRSEADRGALEWARELGDGVRDHPGDRVVGDVERDHVPAEVVGEPPRHEGHHGERRDRPRRQQHRGGEEDDQVGLEREVRGREDLEQVRYRAEQRRDDEQPQVELGAWLDHRSGDYSGGREPRDPSDVAAGTKGQSPEYGRTRLGHLRFPIGTREVKV